MWQIKKSSELLRKLFPLRSGIWGHPSSLLCMCCMFSAKVPCNGICDFGLGMIFFIVLDLMGVIEKDCRAAGCRADIKVTLKETPKSNL